MKQKVKQLERHIAERFLRDKALSHHLERFLSELPKEKIIELLLDKMSGSEQLLPLSIFSVTDLSALELIVRYLKENMGKRNTEIAEMLGRSQQGIWTTYNNARKKSTSELPVTFSDDDFPIMLLKSKRYSVLEAIVVFLKEKRGLRFADIGRMLHKDERTIWTAYKRAQKKNEKQ